MASRDHIPDDEGLDASGIALLQTALRSVVAPVGENGGAGAKAWAAFFEIRDAAGALGRMSMSAVTSRAKVARGPFATVGGRFRLLRQAVREHMLRERQAIEASVAVAAADERRGVEERSIASTASGEALRRRLQVSDSLNAAYLARALAAESSAAEERRKSKRYLAELNERDARGGNGF